MAALPFRYNAIGVGGSAAPGAKLYSYTKGTTTPLTLWSDSALTIPATNPLVADADGRWSCYVSSLLAYSLQGRTSDGATVIFVADITAGMLSVDLAYGNGWHTSWTPALAHQAPRRILVSTQTEFADACADLAVSDTDYGGVIEWTPRGQVFSTLPSVVSDAFNSEARITTTADKGLLILTAGTFPTGRGVFESETGVVEFDNMYLANSSFIANAYGVRVIAPSAISDALVPQNKVRNSDIRQFAAGVRNENGSKFSLTDSDFNSCTYCYDSTNGGTQFLASNINYNGGYFARFAQTSPGFSSEGRNFSNICGVNTGGYLEILGGGFYSSVNASVDVGTSGGAFHKIVATQTKPIQKINIANFWSGGAVGTYFVHGVGPIEGFKIIGGAFEQHGGAGIYLDGSARADMGNTYSAPAISNVEIIGVTGRDRSGGGSTLDLQGVTGKVIGGYFETVNERDDNVAMVYQGVEIGSVVRLSANSVILSAKIGVAPMSTAFQQSFLDGFTLSNNASDATNDIDFAAGRCRDSTNRLNLIGASMTKRLDAAWAAGTGNGGRLSAAAIADTTYHCFAILKDSDHSVDYGFDTSPTAPTMPSGYTRFRRIGSVVRVSGALLAFTQVGSEFLIGIKPLDVNVADFGTGYDLRALTVPTGIKVGALIEGVYYYTAPSSSAQLTITSPEQASSTNGITAYVISNGGTISASSAIATNGPVRTNTSGQIKTRSSIGSGGIGMLIFTRGWIDERIV